MIISKKCRNENNQQQSLKVCLVILKRKFRGSPIVFSGSRISLIWSSGLGISLILNSGFGIESVHGRWDAKNNHRDYGIARNFGSGSRDWRTLLGTLSFWSVKTSLWLSSIVLVLYLCVPCFISQHFFISFQIYFTFKHCKHALSVNPGEALPTTSRPQSILSFKFGTRRPSGRGP